jgi:presenilin-like A22 family membrane protease
MLASMTTAKKNALSPAHWGTLIFIVAQLFTFLVISRVNVFIEKSHIYIPPQPPEAISLWPQPVQPAPPGEVPVPAVGSLGPIIIYFAAIVIVLGIILSLVPVSVLRSLLRVLFAFLFSWGTFIVLIFWLPFIAALLVCIAVGLAWFFIPRVWLHNLAMILALVGLGAVFGRLISPWTAMILISVLALYDFLAVRFRYMLWIVQKLTESSTLPAFIIPRSAAEWNSSLKESQYSQSIEEGSFERKYSILGGGDIGFPLLLVSSTYFGYGFTDAVIVAAFTLLGLLSAYWIQATILKGKAMPALPPIAVLSLMALLIVRYL